MDREEAIRQLDKIKMLTRETLSEMRRLLLELRPNSFSEENLEDLLGQLIRSIKMRSGLSVKIKVKGRRKNLKPLEKEVFYKVAQEALNNLQIAATQVEGLKDLFGFGEAKQTQEQAELTAELEKWMSETGITDPENLSILLSSLGMSYSSSTSSGSTTGAGLGYGMINAAGKKFGSMAGTALGSFLGF